MISVHFQGKPQNITVIQVYDPTTNAKEAEIEWSYEDLQDIVELTHTHTQNRGMECKIGCQEIPEVTGMFGLGLQNKAAQRLTEFCQEKNIGHSKEKTRLYT